MIVILKQTEEKGMHAEGVRNILDNNQARIIDGSMLPEMAKVEVADENMDQLKSHLGDGWEMFPEKKYAVPGTKRKISK